MCENHVSGFPPSRWEVIATELKKRGTKEERANKAVYACAIRCLVLVRALRRAADEAKEAKGGRERERGREEKEEGRKGNQREGPTVRVVAGTEDGSN